MYFLMLTLLLQLEVQAINHDEDINLILPAGEIYHSSYDISGDIYLGRFNNCVCNESPEILLVCFGEDCKDFPIVSTVTKLFKLKLSAVTIIRKDDFRLLDHLEGMEIEGNSYLEKIEERCFRKMSRMRNLTITNNFMLTYLQEKVFEGLDSLETLCLSKNGFKRVMDITRALSTRYVPHLNLLDLSQNIFYSVEEYEFYYMNGTAVQQLNLYLCGINYIHPNCLKPFRNLTFLRVGVNQLNKSTITKLIVQVVEDGIPINLLNLIGSGFRKTPPMELLKAVGKSNITDIVLGRNHFDQIDDESFPEMPNIDTMDLRECFIDSISDGAFRKLHNLTILLLNCNRLNIVPIGVLLPQLIQLDLGGNSDEKTYFLIPNGIFKNMTNLNDLQLCYNNIQFITNQTFIGLSNLIKLNLKNTRLSYIEDGSFNHMPKLLHLNLMKNPLLILSAETFIGLASVNVTLLGHCGIKNLTSYPGIFHYFRNITYLGLQSNDIQSISPDQFTHLKDLNMIHLGDNKLTPWTKPILPKNNFREIIACQNKITFITSAMLEDFQTTKLLSLDDNPLRCDCSLYPVAQWLKYHKMKVEYTEKSNFVARCDSPDNWRKISIVIYLKYLKANPKDCGEFFSYLQLVSIGLCIIFMSTAIVILYLYRWYIRYWIFLSRISFFKHNLLINKKFQQNFSFDYDAFISYSIEDKNWVAELCNQLEPELKFCVFERDFTPGVPISHEVLKAVAVSRRTVLIISEAFVRSNWCRWETQMAQYHQIFFREDNINCPDDTLILVRLQAVKKCATPILRYLLKTRIYLDWPEGDLEKQKIFWGRLKATLSTAKGEINKKYCKV